MHKKQDRQGRKAQQLKSQWRNKNLHDRRFKSRDFQSVISKQAW